MGRRVFIISVTLLTAVLILSGCGKDDPAKTVDQGDELLTTTFDDSGTWEEGTFPTGDEPTSTLAVRYGRYEIDHQSEGNASFIWGQDRDSVLSETAENVIIEVQTEQLSAEKDNLYGVLCRLGEDTRGATGYALLISGDGHFGIAELRSNNLSFLLEWHQTDAIHQGPAINTIRAICVENYLALYVNDTFLGDVKDTMYMRPGSVGFLAGAPEDKAISIAFDNLTIYEGSLSD